MWAQCIPEESTLLGEYILSSRKTVELVRPNSAAIKQTYILVKSVESLEDIDDRQLLMKRSCR